MLLTFMAEKYENLYDAKNSQYDSVEGSCSSHEFNENKRLYL